MAARSVLLGVVVSRIGIILAKIMKYYRLEKFYMLNRFRNSINRNRKNHFLKVCSIQDVRHIYVIWCYSSIGCYSFIQSYENLPNIAFFNAI